MFWIFVVSSLNIVSVYGCKCWTLRHSTTHWSLYVHTTLSDLVLFYLIKDLSETTKLGFAFWKWEFTKLVLFFLSHYICPVLYCYEDDQSACNWITPHCLCSAARATGWAGQSFIKFQRTEVSADRSSHQGSAAGGGSRFCRSSCKLLPFLFFSSV